MDRTRRVAPGLAAALAIAALVVPATTEAQSPTPLAPGRWFDGLDTGVCFQTVLEEHGAFDFATPPPIVPCDEGHDNEVVARVSLGEGAYPDDVQSIAQAACAGPLEEFLGGHDATESGLYAFGIWPTFDDWSAGGVREAICVVEGDGSLVGTARSGSLTAADETLAYYRQPGSAAQAWLARGDGTPTGQLEDGGLTLVLGAPAWSPDGRQVVVTVAPDEDDRDLYLLAVDGSAPEGLRTGEGRQEGGSFSPTGGSFVWSAALGDAELDIYSGDADAPVRLTDRPERDAAAQWSPDGSTILFRRVTDGFSQLWTMAPDGSGQVQLTTAPANHYDPRWSPDGRQIAFSTDIRGSMDVGVMAADGSDAVLLTDHPAEDEFPTWTSDGEMLAFQTSRWGGPTVWLMHADGSDPSALLTQQPSGYPMFAP